MKYEWVRAQDEPRKYTLKTEWGDTAIIRPTRGFPASRKFLVEINGRVVSRFEPDIEEAKKTAESMLEERAANKFKDL